MHEWKVNLCRTFLILKLAITNKDRTFSTPIIYTETIHKNDKNTA